METALTVVILAAGLGTRMKSRKAKVLHQAGGKALIEHVVGTALRLAPAERIFAVVGHQAEEVRAAVRTPGIGFIHQAEQKGTGHALMVGREALEPLGGLLLILYGDCPMIPGALLRDLVAAQHGSDTAATLLTSVLPDPTGYGRVLRDARGSVVGVVEQRAATPAQLAIREANMGIYCFQSDLFFRHLGELGCDNPAREYYLTDMIEILSRTGHMIAGMQTDDPRPVLGINNRVELAEADTFFRQRKVRELMLAGVTIQKPETVTVDLDVEIGADTILGPFTQILGRTVIGENCRVGACSIIQDSELDQDVEIGPFTIVNTSRLERGAHAGPYSRLRMENHVGPGAHIGNFVELKKARVGAGSKAMHLTYLGDAVLGSRVNVGAGTITCNYDGVAKHPTRIGDGVFVGSNSSLVAPLEIGEGAYLAAGSVITEPVPPGALALGRARQVVKPGWTPKRKKG
ncbi:MAG TPA: bifunctional UDP-N-acetylglucosamine diphosphorylase/glucosamine-1-phosphate N-acetyltransferase GlmU [Bryobacteraceae bacterium]|nr:bifunctional UDP-N-acetylglucosamine diphosphorylase/glucosamine-1-phosphate N-acetyltransferase GlmU [Bryobacteraceae bacterium]